MYDSCVLDEHDLALVHALQEAPRASWAQLASTLSSDPRTLARRYGRLYDACLLRVMATAGPRLLEQLVFVHLRVGTAPGQASDVADALARWPQATTIRLTDGPFDVYALLLGARHATLVAAAQERLAALPAVRAAELSTVLQIGDVGRAARLDSLNRRQIEELRGARVHADPTAPAAALTTADLELMQLLAQDGRADIADLAHRLDRDPSAVSRRVAQLQKRGAIDIIAITPDTASSAPVRAFLWCTVAPQELQPLVMNSPSVRWVGLLTVTTGRANVALIANLRTRSQLPRVQAALTSLSPSLQVRETQLSARAVKVHMRRLTVDDRWTDDVGDPYWDLRHELVG